MTLVTPIGNVGRDRGLPASFEEAKKLTETDDMSNAIAIDRIGRISEEKALSRSSFVFKLH